MFGDEGTFIPPDANYSKFDVAIRGLWPIPPMLVAAPSDPATNSACGHHTVELVVIVHGSLCECRKSFPPDKEYASAVNSRLSDVRRYATETLSMAKIPE